MFGAHDQKSYLQIKERIAELHVGRLVERLADEDGQFASVLRRRRHLHRTLSSQKRKEKSSDPTFLVQTAKAYAPVEVEVRHLVGEALHLAGRETGAVVQNLVRGRVHRALAHALTHQEEVVPTQIQQKNKNLMN